MGQQDLKIHELVSKIERGEIRIPEMQREYVWRKTRVRDLLDSLYRGYPSGTILTWETDEPVETRDTPIDQTQGTERFQLLLDGQQRLVSMSAVLRGEPVVVKDVPRPIDILFNLEHPDDLDVVTEVHEQGGVDDADEAEMSDATDDEKERLFDRMAFMVDNKIISRMPHWVSVTEVFKDSSDGKFLEKAGVTSLSDPRYERYSQRIKRLRDIKNYEYRVHVLDGTKTYEEVTEIFVRVNSLGAKLRSSDLALAQITAKWRKSLSVFQEYEQRCKDLGFDFDVGILIRNMVAFVSGQSGFKVVGGLSREKLEDGWEKARTGMDFALDFLRGNLKIGNSALLTSPFLAISIGCYAHGKDYRLSAAETERLRHWALLANAKGRYTRGSAETVLDQELSAIKRGQDIDRLLQLLESQTGRLVVDPGDLENKNVRSAYFKTMFLAFREDNARDWRNGLEISTRRSDTRHSLQTHHIFPKKLMKGRVPPMKVNDISNLAFISGPTNRRIGSKPPSDYFPEVVREQGEGVLEAQAIPTDPGLWRVEAYDEFLRERRRLVAERLNRFLRDPGG